MMKKILLIEDDTVMRENTAEILGLAQYEVLTARDGKEGVEMAQNDPPDLIVCDIMMPKLDGYGVLHILGKDPRTSAIPFLYLTAKAEKSEMRKGMDLGADDYLTKPFEETELLNSIERRLKKSESFKKEFSYDKQGLARFLDQARSVQELEDLSHQKPSVSYKKKDVIFREGYKAQYLYFLSKGKVKIRKAHGDGKDYITGLLKPGEFLGYLALLRDREYEESAEVLEDAEVCRIPKEDFLALIYKNRDVSARFLKILANDVAEKEKQLLSLAYDTVRKKVAEALLRLEGRYRESEKKQFRISIPREDLAGIAGTATETVIRCLSEFKNEGWIDMVGRDILLLNAQGLKDVP